MDDSVLSLLHPLRLAAFGLPSSYTRPTRGHDTRMCLSVCRVCLQRGALHLRGPDSSLLRPDQKAPWDLAAQLGIDLTATAESPDPLAGRCSVTDEQYEQQHQEKTLRFFVLSSCDQCFGSFLSPPPPLPLRRWSVDFHQKRRQSAGRSLRFSNENATRSSSPMTSQKRASDASLSAQSKATLRPRLARKKYMSS